MSANLYTELLEERNELKKQLDDQLRHNTTLRDINETAARQNARLAHQIEGYEIRITDAMSTTFWQRVRFLFTGDLREIC